MKMTKADKIGAIIKSARKQAGLKQTEFAETLTVKQPYISLLERGKTMPTAMFIKLFWGC